MVQRFRSSAGFVTLTVTGVVTPKVSWILDCLASLGQRKLSKHRAQDAKEDKGTWKITVHAVSHRDGHWRVRQLLVSHGVILVNLKRWSLPNFRLQG
jgi:hypothetical protein